MPKAALVEVTTDKYQAKNQLHRKKTRVLKLIITTMILSKLSPFKRLANPQIVLLAVVAILLFQSCSKKHKNGSPLPDNYGDIHQLSITAVDQLTFVLNSDGSLVGRGASLSQSPKANSAGYLHIADGILSYALTNESAYFYVIKKDNTVWRGEIDEGNWDPKYPDMLKADEFITDSAVALSAGSYFGVILKKDSTVWAIGENHNGQFGLGTMSSGVQELPLTKISEGVKQIAASRNSIFLLKADNSLWSAGNNRYGTLGYKTTASTSATFRKVADGVADVRAEGSNMMLIKLDGTAWSCGSNANATQGIGPSSQDPVYLHKVGDQVAAVYPMGITSYMIQTDGTLLTAGFDPRGKNETGGIVQHLSFTPIAEHVSGISNIGSGARHLIILQQGTFKMAGENSEKQISQSDQALYGSFEKFIMP